LRDFLRTSCFDLLNCRGCYASSRTASHVATCSSSSLQPGSQSHDPRIRSIPLRAFALLSLSSRARRLRSSRLTVSLAWFSSSLDDKRRLHLKIFTLDVKDMNRRMKSKKWMKSSEARKIPESRGRALMMPNLVFEISWR